MTDAIVDDTALRVSCGCDEEVPQLQGTESARAWGASRYPRYVFGG